MLSGATGSWDPLAKAPGKQCAVGLASPDWGAVAVIPETQFADTNVGRIAYQISGDGPIDVLVAHPPQFPIDLMWDEPRLVQFLDGLSRFCRHIWFDPRGRGASMPLPHSEGNFQETMAEDILGLLDALDLDTVALLALGGGIVPFVAASHPERVSAMALLGGFDRLLRSAEHPNGMPLDLFDQALVGLATSWGTSEGARARAGRFADDARFCRWWAKSQRLTCTGEEAVWRLRSMLSFDQTSILGAISVPTLVISQPGARMIRADAALDLSRRIPGAKFVELDPVSPLFFLGDTGLLLDTIEEFLTGDLPQHDAERVLATVVFTDIVGSTDHLARVGDRTWKDTLASHDALVSREIERHRGRQIKTTGDGVLATFDGPGRAIKCAQAIAETVRPLGIEVRAGLHTGEIELRGDDVGGIGVHIAARVAGLAGAGEVLVSRTVTDLVAGSGINFEDRGEQELKGVPGSWRVFAVLAKSVAAQPHLV